MPRAGIEGKVRSGEVTDSKACVQLHYVGFRLNHGPGTAPNGRRRDGGAMLRNIRTSKV